MTGKYRGVDAPPAGDMFERKRRSTLDLFNDEMSVLERPLEGDVEYYDETPPSRSGWRKVAVFAAAAAMTAGGALIAMKHFPPKRAAAQPAPVAMAAASVAKAAAAPTAAPAPAPAPASASAKVAVAANEAAPAEAPSGDDAEQGGAVDEAPARHAPVKPTAWVKASHRSGHARHSRSDKASARHHKHHR